jgi:predicted dehydrogenase
MDRKKIDRRHFLYTLGSAAGAGLLLTSIPHVESIFASENNGKNKGLKARLGIIGIGDRGKLLLTYLLMNQNAEIVAISDNYEPNMHKAIEMTGGLAKPYIDYRRLLERKDIDAVIIAVPLHEHARITLDAFQAGKHVFCEKSMARTIEDTQKMVKAYKNSGKILQIGHQRLFNPKYLKAYEMVKNGEIGKIGQIRAYWHRNANWRRPVPRPELERKINWRLYKEYSVGLMTELASHQIQVANWFLGEVPTSVCGAGSIVYWKDGREVYDNVNLVYSYPSGINLIYDSMISNKHYGLEEQIMGDKGTLEMEVGKFYQEEPAAAPAVLQLINDIEHKVFDTIPIGGPSWVPETATSTKGEYIIKTFPQPDDTQLEMDAFVDRVISGKPSDELVKQGYYATIAALAGQEAMEKGSTIAFPKDDLF